MNQIVGRVNPKTKGYSFTGDVKSIALSPNGLLLATGSSDHLIQLWRTSDGTLLKTLTGHTQAVFSLAFSPDGQTLASASGYLTTSYGGDGNTIRFWRVSDGILLRTLFGPTESFQYQIAFSPDGQTLWVGKVGEYAVRSWRVADGASLGMMATDLPLNSFTLSPDGTVLAALTGLTTFRGFGSYRIELRRTSNGTLVRSIQLTGDYGGRVIAYSPDGQTVTEGRANERGGGNIQIFRVSDGALLSELTPPGPGGPIRITKVSPDGQLIANNGSNRLILRRVSDGAVVRVLPNPGDDSSISGVAFSPDSGFVAVAAPGNPNSYLGLMRVSDGQIVRTFSTNFGDVQNGVAFSPDGQ